MSTSMINWPGMDVQQGQNPGSNQFMTNTPYMPTSQNSGAGTGAPSFGGGPTINSTPMPSPSMAGGFDWNFGNSSGASTSTPAAPATTPLTFTGPPGASGMTGIGKGMYAQNPIDPALTSQFFQWLQSQIGQGVPGFNQSTTLPSSGQSTQPGQLNAPLNSILQQMMQMFNPQSGSLGQLASGGIDATPVWQKTVDALQRQTAQGANNLREQFAFSGNLDSSPFGQSMVDYQTQSDAQNSALLANMQFQGIQDQLAASGQEQGFGQFMQGLDQQAIQNQLQEFIRTSPQYNPLLGMMFGASTTFPPVLQPQSGVGGLGGLLGGLGGILGSLPGLKGMFGTAGGGSGGGGGTTGGGGGDNSTFSLADDLGAFA